MTSYEAKENRSDIIRSSLYLITNRSDIMFSICIYVKFQSNPKESHLFAIKRILRYLICIFNIVLWYFRDSFIELIDFYDADFACYKLDRKSISETVSS